MDNDLEVLRAVLNNKALPMDTDLESIARAVYTVLDSTMDKRMMGYAGVSISIPYDKAPEENREIARKVARVVRDVVLRRGVQSSSDTDSSLDVLADVAILASREFDRTSDREDTAFDHSRAVCVVAAVRAAVYGVSPSIEAAERRVLNATLLERRADMKNCRVHGPAESRRSCETCVRIKLARTAAMSAVRIAVDALANVGTADHEAARCSISEAQSLLALVDTK